MVNIQYLLYGGPPLYMIREHILGIGVQNVPEINQYGDNILSCSDPKLGQMFKSQFMYSSRDYFWTHIITPTLCLDGSKDFTYAFRDNGNISQGTHNCCAQKSLDYDTNVLSPVVALNTYPYD